MRKEFLLVFLTLILLSNCSGQESKIVPPTRDKTITPATSFSKLFFDSLELELFIRRRETSNISAAQQRNFYTGRNYQFAWFTENGVAEHTRTFWNLHNNYIKDFADTAIKYKLLHHQIDKLMNEDTVVKIATERLLHTELELTRHFFEYSNNAYIGKLDPNKLQWYIPRKKINAVLLLDSLIARKGKSLEDWEPVNIYYLRLKKELIHYYQIEKAGGWQSIVVNESKKLKPGDSVLRIKQLKQRLELLTDINIADTSQYSAGGFVAGIKKIQKSFGLKEDGIISAALTKKLNVPVEERIKQLLINLERMRWIPQLPETDLIAVNIPEFKLHVFENGRRSFSLDIIVGKAASKTVIFTSELEYIVFSPYWNVPRSIVKNEILPAMIQNPNYLSQMNMEQTGYSDGLPVIRQKPGSANALGEVKFIFPNSYNIYFHDTPAKSLFKEDGRAFSHGCIRLKEPIKLAAHLLRNQSEWTTQKINIARASNVEKWIPLKKSLPVFISYFTAWVDGDGLLNFRDDIYGHDKRLAKQLFR